MELEKLVKINLDEEPIDTAVQHKNIAFYNLDKNTAKFQFLVTNKKRPLLVSSKNVKGYAFFKSENGSTSGAINLDFIDPMKGLLGLTLPTHFLNAATNTLVYGELYLSLNDADGKGKDDTVVLGRFSFKVKESLINEIESDIKVRYIQKFDDLNDEIREKVDMLTIDIENINNVVNDVKAIGETAKADITLTKDASIEEITVARVSAITEIVFEKTNALTAIDEKEGHVLTSYELALTDFNTNVEAVTAEFNENTANANNVIDAKMTEFNANLANNNFVTNEGLSNTMNESNWQKFRLTLEDGGAIYINFSDKTEEDILALETGIYYLSNATISATPSSKNAFVTVKQRSGGVIKHVEFRPYNSSQVWLNRYYTEWSGWELISHEVSDTDWILLDFINGAVVNNAALADKDKGFVSAYRIVEDKGTKRLLLRLNGSNIDSGQIIAQLPNDIVTGQQRGFVSTADANGFAVATVRTGGQININIPAPHTSTWKKATTNWFYGQLEFTI